MKTLKCNFDGIFQVTGLLLFLVFFNFTNIYAQNDTGFIATDNFGSRFPNPPDSIRVFDFVQIPPKFMSGDIHKYYNDTITFPAVARVKQGHGLVWVNFVVEKDGSVSTVTIIRTTDTALNKEAIKIALAAKWTPGQQNGKPVRVSVIKPINFQVYIAPEK